LQASANSVVAKSSKDTIADSERSTFTCRVGAVGWRCTQLNPLRLLQQLVPILPPPDPTHAATNPAEVPSFTKAQATFAGAPPEGFQDSTARAIARLDQLDNQTKFHPDKAHED